MNQEVLKQSQIILNDRPVEDPVGGSLWRSYIPFLIAILGSVTLLLARINFGGDRFISDGALMILAARVISYSRGFLFDEFLRALQIRRATRPVGRNSWRLF